MRNALIETFQSYKRLTDHSLTALSCQRLSWQIIRNVGRPMILLFCACLNLISTSDDRLGSLEWLARWWFVVLAAWDSHLISALSKLPVELAAAGTLVLHAADMKI